MRTASEYEIGFATLITHFETLLAAIETDAKNCMIETMRMRSEERRLIVDELYTLLAYSINNFLNSAKNERELESALNFIRDAFRQQGFLVSATAVNVEFTRYRPNLYSAKLAVMQDFRRLFHSQMTSSYENQVLRMRDVLNFLWNRESEVQNKAYPEESNEYRNMLFTKSEHETNYALVENFESYNYHRFRNVYENLQGELQCHIQYGPYRRVSQKFILCGRKGRKYT